MRSKIDILNLEWITEVPSRDRAISSLVCNYLRYLGYSVFEGSVFNGYKLLKDMRPSVLFISNSIGAPLNSELVKYANNLGIICFSGFSEGNFRENLIHEFIWGHNKDRIFYEKHIFLWSEKKKELVVKYYNELNEQIKVCGGIGFDMYKIRSKYISKLEFQRKYQCKNNFLKIIGVGCYDFGPFDERDSRYTDVVLKTSDCDLLMFKKDRTLFQKILEQIIQINPDILFLLKEHPSNELGHWASAIDGLDIYNNVLILKNQATIFECISISDIWVTYESTTALEAWLMNKQTCLLNPCGGDFYRDEISKGSPIYQNSKQLQNAIDQFYSKGSLPGFDELIDLREELIRNTIQWSDGLNHVRAGNIIADAAEKKNSNWSLKKWVFATFQFVVIKQIVYWYTAAFIEKHLNFLKGISFVRIAVDMRYYNSDRILHYSKSLYNEQKGFYEKSGFLIKQLRDIKAI